MVGHFPLVLAIGPGVGAHNRIGIVLVSGTVIGTLFTRFVVPSIYVLVTRQHVPALAQADEAVWPRLARPARGRWIAPAGLTESTSAGPDSR